MTTTWPSEVVNLSAMNLCHEQANTWGSSPGPFFESIIKGVCTLIDAGWVSERGTVESFLLALAAYIRDKDKVTPLCVAAVSQPFEK